ncbi:MAG TPA: L,D-transpeptidase, partial [Chthoniobacterales bacterium]|nr:L,D-transpeptidase [Chthoniobacterales bacterium]
ALLFLSFAAPLGLAAPGYSVEIDLQQQMAYLIHGRQLVLASPISSGRAGYNTKTGSFKIIEKKRTHFSNLYGKIVDARGRTVVADADADMRVPRGGRFVPAPMHYFMRYNGAEGMHAGYLPGYPASHGCVRLPREYAIAFFNAVDVGTPVHVFGRTPRQNDYFRYGPQPRQPRYQPRLQPRFDQRYFDPRMDPRFDPRYNEPIYDPRFAEPPDVEEFYD